jgi:hypothetical protein
MATSAPLRSPKACSVICCSLTSRLRQIVAGNWRNAFQAAQGATAGIDFDLLIAGFAVQFEFVMLLQAGLPDMVCALVVRLLLGISSIQLEVAVGDPTDVADGVRGDATQRILAE